MMNDPALRSLIVSCFSQPQTRDSEITSEVAQFIRTELGITIFSKEWMNWHRCDMWQFALNSNGGIITEDPPRTKFESCKAKKSYRLLTSHQGPFATVESHTLKPSNYDPWHDCSWTFDETTDPRAVAWAQAIAQRFNLHYVDAPSLRNWEVDRDALPDKGSFLDYSEPTAFNILFYE